MLINISLQIGRMICKEIFIHKSDVRFINRTDLQIGCNIYIDKVMSARRKKWKLKCLAVAVSDYINLPNCSIIITWQFFSAQKNLRLKIDSNPLKTLFYYSLFFRKLSNSISPKAAKDQSQNYDVHLSKFPIDSIAFKLNQWAKSLQLKREINYGDEIWQYCECKY